MSIGMAGGLLGGLALFLLGLEQLTRSLRAATGDGLKTLLSRMSRTPAMGALSGAVATAVLQSSSVTTVLVIGFVSAGLLTLSQAAGVIIGANLGSTATAQIIAFDVIRFSLAMIGAGFVSRALRRLTWLREGGAVLLGLGLIFFGMGVMGDAVAPLRDHPPFVEFMAAEPHDAVALLAALVFTAIVQSSAATVGVVIVLASQGLLTLPAAIAAILGANIGTCVTAALAAIGRSRPAMRAAGIHIAVNVIGVLIWIGFVDQLTALAVWVSPAADGLDGAARLAAETPRQIANAHTAFNLANTILFIGFTRPLARLLERVIPDRADDLDEAEDPRYLDDDLLSARSVALEMVRLETVRLARRVQLMVAAIVPAALTGTARQLRAVAEMDHRVDRLHRLIVAYLAKIGRARLTDDQSRQMLRLLSVANHLEQIGDVVETNLVTLGLHRVEEGIRPSAATLRVVSQFHAAVQDQFDAAVRALEAEDPRLAAGVRGSKKQIRQLSEDATAHQAERLFIAGPSRVQAYTRETEILEHLRRIYVLTRGLAEPLTDEQHPATAANPLRPLTDTETSGLLDGSPPEGAD